jgi:lipopolysaccharide export system protein LptA
MRSATHLRSLQAYNSKHVLFSKIHALKIFSNALLCFALLFSVQQLAFAEREDKNRPMNIEADALVHDDLKQVTVFTGRVVVTKGTIVLKGERIEIKEDPQGFQFGLITPGPGARAFYRQKREGLNEFMEGEAERIEYDGRLDRVTLSQRAVLRRYRGSALNDEMSGQVITYDHLSETFRIDGKPTPQGSGRAAGAPASSAEGARALGLLAPKPENRVRAVLTPVPAVEGKP